MNEKVNEMMRGEESREDKREEKREEGAFSNSGEERCNTDSY